MSKHPTKLWTWQFKLLLIFTAVFMGLATYFLWRLTEAALRCAP